MPLVSVSVLTYNHEKFISKAVEGILIQKADFDFDIIVGDDCSTDKTREILLNFKRKYPQKFKLLLNPQNIGPAKNAIQTFKACTGEYVAICDGDDYWTDPYKLQKQVDFLEKNKNYSVCFHYVDVVNEKNEIIKEHSKLRRNIYDQKDIFLQSKKETQASSMVFRMECIPNPLPNWFLKVNNGDKFLKMLLLEKNKAFILKESMSCYRLHRGGIWSALDSETRKKKLDQDLDMMINLFGPKFPHLIPKLRAKHESNYIFYYIKNRLYRKALFILLYIPKYPLFFLITIKKKIISSLNKFL